MIERRRYRKISTRIWGDEKFRKLSRPGANAQTLWFYLLTGPETSVIPGLMTIGELALAEALGWRVGQLRKCFAELVAGGMVTADWASRLVWLPKSIYHNQPENPNVVSSWRATFGELPECPLKALAGEAIVTYLSGRGDAFLAAWGYGCLDLEDKAAWEKRRKVSPEVARLVRERDGAKCRYCGNDVDWRDRRGSGGGTYDHVQPKGADDEANIVVACRSCNSVKGNRTPDEAGMVLLGVPSKSKPRSKPRSGSGSDSAQPSNQEQEQEQEQESMARDARKTEDAAMGTGRFIRKFCDLYAQHCDGAKYHIVSSRHIPLVRSLLRTYGTERLEKLAMVMLTATADAWLNDTDRGIEVLHAKINWLERRLTEYEREHGEIRVA